MTRNWVAAALVVLAGAASCGGDDGPRAPDVARAVSTSVCSPLTYGGEGSPRFLIPLVGPLQGPFSDHGIQNAQAIKLVLAQRGWRAGEHGVAIQVCDESSADEAIDVAKCERDANAFARNASIVAVVGPSSSSCAATMLPLLNDAAGGPLADAGIGSTYVGLTRAGPGVQEDDPERLYPSGRRSYFRTVAADDAQAAAAVLVARRGGARRTFALHDGTTYGQGAALAFQASARLVGLTPVGTARWDGAARGYRPLAARIRRTGADAVYVAGLVASNGPRLIRDLRAGLGDRVQLMAPDGFNQPTAIVEGAGELADGFMISLSAAPVKALPPPGRRWAAEFRKRWGAAPCCYAVHAGQVMNLVLDAIARSDGSRADVLRNLQQASVRGGLVGDFHFDRYGDSTLTTVATYRIRGGKLRYEQTLEVPRELLTRR
jgi:branched-chain amino acid transport system substrate-binding protein